MARWKMSRAGILNFWCYDEEEFVFEDGKMILRGANGSGKSVTMQSLVPLVLDGDKRPERLDPFGSRDRRMEYYLLGEAEKGHTDRTGYLWIEFYHEQKNIYKTIGIGLRARRGVAQLGFWGFLLEDGRRINHDFYLYDRTFWIERKKKLPLNRKILEETISSGGQVVQEQAGYRSMVNKALFNFREEDAYKDLLKLLLELRSPKLSKDFKPSSIYEILTRSLPPLQDEELSSLTNVIEDMDQISDSLEELRRHIQALDELERCYNRYNCFLLLEHSREILEENEKYNNYSRQVNAYEETLRQVQEQQNYISNEISRKKRELSTIEAMLGVIDNSTAMNRQRELDLLEEQKGKLDKQFFNVNSRLNDNQGKLKKIIDEVERNRNKLEGLLAEQEQSIAELNDLSQVMEFHEHNIYHRLWSREIPGDEQWIKNWMRDLEIHKQKLLSAQATASAEQEASNATAEAEKKLGEASRERSLVEKEQAEEEEKLETIKQGLKEDTVRWHQNLKLLDITGDQLRDMLKSLTQMSIKNRNYETVRRPALETYEYQKQNIIHHLLEVEQRKNVQMEKSRLLEEELQQWRLSKEPEPDRTEGRAFSRCKREKDMGAPLYEACEFSMELSEPEQAQLEATLMQAGILDAWILPGGNVQLLNPAGEEEIWIKPIHEPKGKTLSSVLFPMPTAESGLAKEDILSVLNSIGWLEDESLRLGESEEVETAYISEKGRYRLGPLWGSNLSKPRAEYIGIETRRRTKQLEIARLEVELDQVKEEIEKLNGEADGLKKQTRLMQEEIAAFPDDQVLQFQLETLFTLFYRLKEKIESEQKAEEYFRQKLSLWQQVQIKLIEQTSNWSRIKKEPQISEAINFCQDYRGIASGLCSLWMRYRDLSRFLQDQTDQQSDLEQMIEKDQEEKQEMENQEGELSAKIDQLQKLMVELGIDQIRQQIKDLKEQRSRLIGDESMLNKHAIEEAKNIGSAMANVNTSRERVVESRNDLERAIGQWRMEWKLALIPRWKEQIVLVEDEKAVVKICRQIIKEYQEEYQQVKRDIIISKLSDELTKSRINLTDYALTKDEESGRILITSKKDQMNPLTPKELLDELVVLEKEQQALLTDRDRDLYEEIIIGSVGKAIRNRIHRARDWVVQMDELMRQQNNSSGLKLSLKWMPLGRKSEDELDTEALVELLMRDAERMEDGEVEQVTSHFRARILWAKQVAQEEQATLRRYIYQLLDYRSWFEFRLEYRKGQQSNYFELTDSKFNALSGGEKAMSMYIPLFAATYARYNDAGKEAPRIISLDEAFAGVDETNMREMFQLLTDMGFDYIMTSQVLWGCYDTVLHLAIYEIHRPKDTDIITLFHYRWNGERRVMVDN